MRTSVDDGHGPVSTRPSASTQRALTAASSATSRRHTNNWSRGTAPHHKTVRRSNPRFCAEVEVHPQRTAASRARLACRSVRGGPDVGGRSAK